MFAEACRLHTGTGLALVALALAGCGGGSSGTAATAPVSRPVVVAVNNSAPAARCPNGGITVDAGIDSNGNGVLDAAEVSNSQYVCNGAPGANGQAGSNGTNGTNGANGANGSNSLVKLSTEPAGANCPSAGTRIDTGLDANGNNALDSGEISATAYVCNGAAGATGTSGSNGSNGATGANGANGSSTLMKIVGEPAGGNCASGGSKITSGLDSNGNGVLDISEVSATGYVCNGAVGATGAAGAAGATLAWVDVTGSAVQAQPNTGYIAHNDLAEVTVTLPTSPHLGDTVRVSGLGIGGWKIAQNAGQQINARNLGVRAGDSWLTRYTYPVAGAVSVASSADGTRLVAAAAMGNVMTSDDAGATWTMRFGARNWQGVAMSADGNTVAAISTADQILVSYDAGTTWSGLGPMLPWQSIAMSADGSKLIAVADGGQIHTSADAGQTWSARESVRQWRSAGISADGSRMVAGALNDQLYVSSDGGLNWAPKGSVQRWLSLAASSDGMKWVAAATNDQIYTSSDGGQTWTARETVRTWVAVASSADGQKLLAAPATLGSPIYLSTDGGATWKATAVAGIWKSLASSSDGNRLAAGPQGTRVFTSSTWTTSGGTGFIRAGASDALELQYQGSGNFNVLSYAGSFTVQ